MTVIEKIQELRDKTGLGLLNCKKALEDANGDVEKAIELLRKKGLLVAEKRSANNTSAGIIHTYVHAGSQIGVMLEINCETDFVARTDTVREFANNLALHIVAFKPLAITSDEIDKNVIQKEEEIARAQLEAAKKPQNIIDSIIAGKVKKFYSENCLLEQAYIKNDKITVDEYLKEIIAKVGENIRIKRFARFEIGF